MSIDLTQTLVIGVSTRALFNLEEENNIFQTQGVKAFKQYQSENKEKPLLPGTAFYLIESLLALNKQATTRVVEVVIMSRNSPETGLRVLNSLKKYELDITRMAFTGGKNLSPYMESYSIDLFLSKDAGDVQNVIDSKTAAAALIYNPPASFNVNQNQVKIAFDADAVIFSDESEQIFKKDGLEAFQQHEKNMEEIPLQEGPFANLLKKLSKVQQLLANENNESPIRLAIVTARCAPAHLRIINTLKEWGAEIDEIHFLGGISKDKVLHAFGAHIFFDDQDHHLDTASKLVPAAKVLYNSKSPLNKK
jgi:5'-nucleotidase